MWIVYLGAIVVPLLFLFWNLLRGTPGTRADRVSRRELRESRRSARAFREAAPNRMAAVRPSDVSAGAQDRRPPVRRRPSLGRRLAAAPGAFAAGFRIAWSELLYGPEPPPAPRALPAAPARLQVVPGGGTALPAPHVPRTPSVPGWVPAPGYAAAPTQSGEGMESVRMCPDCAEMVPRRAAVCSHCGHRFVYGAAADIA